MGSLHQILHLGLRETHTLGQGNSMVMKLPPNELAGVLQLRGWCGSETALNYILSLLHKFRENSLKFAPRLGLWNCGILVARMTTVRKGFFFFPTVCTKGPRYVSSPVRLRCDQGCHFLEAQLWFKQRGSQRNSTHVHIESKAGREARGAEREAQRCGC